MGLSERVKSREKACHTCYDDDAHHGLHIFDSHLPGQKTKTSLSNVCDLYVSRSGCSGGGGVDGGGVAVSGYISFTS